jgi:hypothetical protein
MRWTHGLESQTLVLAAAGRAGHTLTRHPLPSPFVAALPQAALAAVMA